MKSTSLVRAEPAELCREGSDQLNRRRTQNAQAALVQVSSLIAASDGDLGSTVILQGAPG